MNYELAKKLYKQMITDGWNPEAACNEACISYYLILDEQTKMWTNHRKMTPNV